MKVWHTKSGYKIYCLLAGRSNVFLLSGENKNILIDTSPSNRWNRLKRSLNRLNIKNIDYLILTHTHFDHSGNSAEVKNHFNAKVVVSRKESAYLQKGESSIPHGTVFFARLLRDKIVPLLPLNFNFKPCRPDILVDQYFDLNIFGIKAYIIYTPGHSPGSQSIIVDDEIAIVGDSMFGIFPGSIFPPFADNDDDLIKSWGKLLETGCYLFLPSHGTPNSRKLVQESFEKRTAQ
jgi:hydroxyacylglutathione hydrolase